jgi:hypothetical protein
VIQEQRPDPGFRNLNLDGEAVAVAEVTVDGGGTRWFVIARDNDDGSTQHISEGTAKSHAARPRTTVVAARRGLCAGGAGRRPSMSRSAAGRDAEVR